MREKVDGSPASSDEGHAFSADLNIYVTGLRRDGANERFVGPERRTLR